VSKPILVFDMDGVLVDVTESYRETIAQTVEHFTGAAVPRERIQELKNQGGWNDDWKLSHHMVTEAGVDVPFEYVKEHFQKLFLGGLIEREKWVARPGTLERLADHFQLAVFTGSPREEAVLSLKRFAPGLVFEPLIAMEDVVHHKPDPEGLLRIVGQAEGRPAEAFYIGDTVDDARAAKAAKVRFIGIAAPSNPLYIDLVFLFQDEGAYAIVDDINYLEEVFAA
jgi:HAD superfamily phosphatase